MKQSLRIVHHAILYALLCRSAWEQLGREEGEALMDRATFLYGFRRGRRMAQNARKYGASNDLAGYFLFGELSSRPGENHSVLEFQEDQTFSKVERCAWAEAWKQYGLWEYGKNYCRQVDSGLCAGYNGGFYLTVEQTMGGGGEYCLFRWSDGLTKEELEAMEIRRKELNGCTVQSYAFHCRELLEVTKETLEAAGVDAAPVLRQATEEWKALFPDCAPEEASATC